MKPASIGNFLMTDHLVPDWCARSGLASLSDFQDPSWLSRFEQLSREQEEFLRYEHVFRSANYKWPRDPLHNWSRVWEYPYAFEHLRALGRAPGIAQGAPLQLLDVGSGVTFFPFALAKLGWHVVCSDIDPVAKEDLEKAAAVVPHAPGAVSFRMTDGSTLPASDAEVDAVSCISVLEHVPEPASVIGEMARVLKPGRIHHCNYRSRFTRRPGNRRRPIAGLGCARGVLSSHTRRPIHPEMPNLRGDPSPSGWLWLPSVCVFLASRSFKSFCSGGASTPSSCLLLKAWSCEAGAVTPTEAKATESQRFSERVKHGVVWGVGAKCSAARPILLSIVLARLLTRNLWSVGFLFASGVIRVFLIKIRIRFICLR